MNFVSFPFPNFISAKYSSTVSHNWTRIERNHESLSLPFPFPFVSNPFLPPSPNSIPPKFPPTKRGHHNKRTRETQKEVPIPKIHQEGEKKNIDPSHARRGFSFAGNQSSKTELGRSPRKDRRTHRERGGLESSGESRIEGSCTTGRAAVSVKRLTMMDGYAWCVWVKPPPVLAWPGLAWPGPARGAAHMRAQPAPTELLLSLHLCTTPLRYATPRRPTTLAPPSVLG